MSYGGFSLWHNWVIDHVAFGTDMLSFKPTEEDSLTLQELMALNPDVRGWITIDGTHIDYPLVQGQYDYEYLNKDPLGNYSLSGSIFMSTTNAPDFSDPYTLIYGHHMDNGAMFGDIDLFEKRSFFEEHSTGTLYTKDRTYKVEIFSCVFTDAYDSNIYSQEAQTNEDLVSFEEYAKKRIELEKAVVKNEEQQRDIEENFFKEHDKLIEQLSKAKAKMEVKIEEKKAERMALRNEINELDLYYTENGEE